MKGASAVVWRRWFLALVGGSLALLLGAGVAAAETSGGVFDYDAPQHGYDDPVVVAPGLAVDSTLSTEAASLADESASSQSLLRLGYIYDSPFSFVAPSTGGTTLVADDAVSIRVADRAPVALGQHNVVLHGDANGFVGATVDDVAAAVRADPAYGGQPICLLSCNSASNGSAQALATQLDVPVQAPTGLVGVPRPPAAPEVVLGPGSESVWFYPGGP